MAKNINASGQYGNSQFTVSPTSVDAGYTTILEAVTDAAAVNGTVYIFPGTYTESITWPPNVAIIGASTGENTIDVEINGNQTFLGEGILSFRSIKFTSTVGNTFSQTALISDGVLEFEDCNVTSNVGISISSASTGLNISSLFLKSCGIFGSLQAVEASDNSILDLKSSRFTTSQDNINTIDLSENSSLNSTLCSFNTSGLGTGACISLNGVNNSVDSANSRYNAGNAAAATAFRFTIAGGIVRSVKDEMFIGGGTYWASSTGAFGTLSYGSSIINTGTTALIDPQISSTPLEEIPGSDSIDTINTDGGSAAPTSGAFTIAGGTGITTSGAASTVTATLDSPVSVANGGTGQTSLSDGGILIGAGTSPINQTSQPVDGQLLVGSTGLTPVLSALTAGTGINITNGAGSITISSLSAGFNWSVQASGTALLPQEGYISTSGSSQNFPLPATSVVGELFELTQNGAGIVTITQIAGQSIRFGNSVTTIGVGGSIASSAIGDAIKLVCTVANTTFQVVTGSIGNWVVT